MGVTHQLHHKYAIADANFLSSNPAVLTGSHNWSSNAENNSDENTLIIYDSEIANIYLQEFEHRWCELDPTTNCYEPSTVLDVNKININVVPNPSNGKIFIRTAQPLVEVKVFSSQARYLFSSQEKVINISNPGAYFVEVITDSERIVKKVIVN